KQLHYMLGDKFQKGIQLYFKKHAFKNTKLSDFFSALEQASDQKLGPWIEEWIAKEGLNSVTANYKCAAGKIELFELLQTAPEDHPTLRTHRTKVGLYYL